MSILDEGYFRKINSPSVAVGYDISPLKRVKFKFLTTSR
jgi:16S rRNA U516 pseudouridylate synthase RsuA-like enzyme